MRKRKASILFFVSVTVFVLTGVFVTVLSHSILKEDKKFIAVAEVFSSLDRLRLDFRLAITAHSYYLLTKDQNTH
ncbi:MAG: hypothetical protein JXB24_03075 [Bacteroidales bacterium]|nr:hypothetical protein [Bacteroidales bacterium]